MKSTIPFAILLGFALTILAADCSAEVPRVETNFNQMAARQWAGKPFRDIISPQRIHRIICLTERGFAHHNNSFPDYRSLVQADYDALVAHLIASDEPAGDYTRDAQEGSSARLLFVTTDNQVFEIEVFTRMSHEISGIAINGPGAGARINVKGFQRAARRK